MKHFLLITLIVFSCGCHKDTTTQIEIKTAHLGESFELHAGEAVTISGEPLSFRFDSLLNESRCPLGVECFWQGNASIVISCAERHDTLDTYFVPSKIVQSAYTLTLRDLTPYPIYQQPIIKENYVAQFVVNKTDHYVK